MNKKPYEEFKQQLNQLSMLDTKPTLLLHSCCGPCSTHVLNLLSKCFRITVFYYNPNIYPVEEFDKRLETQRELLEKLDYHVDLIVEKDDYQVYLDFINGYENLGEKSMRCYKCYEFRIKKLQEVALQKGFDYFTTTLSVSPHKNSLWINEIGNSLSLDKCKFLYSDFKKENGYLNSTTIAKQYELYRQDYCGCHFSFEEALKRREEKNQKNGENDI